MILYLAEVLRGEEFLQADDLRAAVGGFAYFGQGFGERKIRNPKSEILNLTGCNPRGASHTFHARTLRPGAA